MADKNFKIKNGLEIGSPDIVISGNTVTLPSTTDVVVGRSTVDVLTNKTLTDPVISSISNGGTITIPSGNDTLVGRATTDTLSNKTFRSVSEVTTTSATAANGLINFDVVTQSMLYFTSNSTGNWTINVRGNSTTTLNSMLPVGNSLTVVFMATNGGTAFYQTGFQIDGVSQTLRWQGGAAPTEGTPSSIDVYSFSITKTSASPTYVVLASVAGFA